MKRILLSLVIFFAVSIFADTGQWYIETNPASGNPEAVWSAKGGSDSSYEIRYSYLDGTEWAPSVAITTDSVDDLDPRLAFDLSGNRNAVWWSDGTYDIIQYSYLPFSGGSWSSPLSISSSSENCRYPSVVAHNSEVWFSYERINNSGYRDVLCSTKEYPEPFPTFVISNTQRQTELRTKIHSINGHLWVDWIDSASYLGYSERISGLWSSAQYESYSGEDDVENGRQRIRLKIVGN
ncbi:MAG: hypothetical protein AB1756_09705 [Acidobacteriota bacterium]